MIVPPALSHDSMGKLRVSDHKRSSSGGNQPISRHPLFPAIVALWFGALFGLASVALKPAMIEGAVVTLGIDKVLPMAAPPLGSTARILVALAMTCLGALIGALLARRLARPAPASQHRRRNAAPTALAEAATLSEERPAGRRRTAAGTPVAESEPPKERVRNPKGDTQILNVSEFDLDDFQGPETDAVADDGDHDQTFTPETAAETPAPFGQPIAETSEHHSSEQALDQEVLSNSLFEAYSRVIPAQTDAAPETDATYADLQDHEEPAAADWSDADMNHLSPHANSGADGFIEAEYAEPEAEMAEEAPQPLQGTSFPQSANVAPPSFQDEAAGDERAAMEPKAQPQADNPVSRTAAERIATAELDELSPIELLERLALAMAQRRERDRVAALSPAPAPTSAPTVVPAAAPVPVQPAATLEIQAAPEPEAEPEPVSEAAAEPELHHEPEPEAVQPPEPETAAIETAAVEPAPAEPQPLRFAIPRLGMASTPRAARAETPAPAGAFEEPEDIAPARIPAALRPVSFSDLTDEDEDDSLPGYIPPRHIGQAPSRFGNAGFHAPISDEIEAEDDFGEDFDTTEEDANEDEGRELEEGYSSLLDLSRPLGTREKRAQQFVRIEEPEDNGEIQPVVIFPGDEAAQHGPFAGPASPLVSSAPEDHQSRTPPAPPSPTLGERLFDGPGKSDPEETEQALRAALATLQRMSGAA